MHISSRDRQDQLHFRRKHNFAVRVVTREEMGSELCPMNADTPNPNHQWSAFGNRSLDLHRGLQGVRLRIPLNSIESRHAGVRDRS